jgi:Kef-type K+ transport system membrane component KefB
VGIDSSSLLLAAFIAVLAPLFCELPLPLRLPMVVLEVALGIVVGPHLLGWAKPEGMVGSLGHLGLIFLFFLAGMEIDMKAVRGEPLSRAFAGWLLSLGLALIIGTGLYLVDFARNCLLISAVLTTSTLGVMLPVLRDSDEVQTKFGCYVLAAGITGELGPIVLVSLLFTRDHTHWTQTLFMVMFVLVTLGAALIALSPTPPRIIGLMSRTMEAASQLPVRLAILALMMLVALATKFGLDMILGAFASGMVVGLGSRGEQGVSLRHKLDAIGFGFLIPMFFVSSGMKFDLPALFQSPQVLLRIPLFLFLFLIVRGSPGLLYRHRLGVRDRISLGLYSSTALPLIIALTELGVETGRMSTRNAAALVGAGMISVLLFPVIAMALHGKREAASVIVLPDDVAQAS